MTHLDNQLARKISDLAAEEAKGSRANQRRIELLQWDIADIRALQSERSSKAAPTEPPPPSV